MKNLKQLMSQIADRNMASARDLKKQVFSKYIKPIFIDRNNNERIIDSKDDLIEFLYAEIRDLQLYIDDINAEMKGE